MPSELSSHTTFIYRDASIPSNRGYLPAGWRRFQSEGLQSDFNNDDEVRTFCAKLDDLAILPSNDVIDGMAVFREQAPQQLQCLVEYFDSNCVNGSFRAVMSASGHMRFRRLSPRFPQYFGMYTVPPPLNTRTAQIISATRELFI